MTVNVTFRMKPILPENVNDKGMLKFIRDALVKESKEVVKEFDKGTESWKRKPEWKIDVHSRGGDWRARVLTGSKPFIWVEAGTMTRHRIMSRNWRSKTQPRVLRSGPGAGKPVGFTPRNKPIRPGIKAREFREVISEKYEPEYVKAMTEAVFTGAQLFFSGTRTGENQFTFTIR